MGGGLAGLGAGLTAPTPLVIVEALARPGGLTLTDSMKGFHFDKTGHIIHLRRPVEKRLIRGVLRGLLTKRKRKAAFYMRGKLLPYPFQTHFLLLGEPLASRCLEDFKKARKRWPKGGVNKDFEAWCRTQFGDGIAEAFMLPYNEKLFRIAPKKMNPSWRGVYIPRPSMAEVMKAKREGELSGQGYNAVFSYPKKGGIEALPRGLAKMAGKRPGLRLLTGRRVRRIDLAKKRVALDSGKTLGWERLISTLPLPETLKLCGKVPSAIRAAASRLRWVGVVNVNLGFKGNPWPGIHWVYFSEKKYPFYRIGFPSRFSNGAAPRGTTSCYVEVSYRPEDGPDVKKAEREVLASMRDLGLLAEKQKLMVLRSQVIPYAYVVFDHHRAQAVRVIHEWLAGKGVVCAGRYGEWTYGSMEDALASGREAGIRLSSLR